VFVSAVEKRRKNRIADREKNAGEKKKTEKTWGARESRSHTFRLTEKEKSWGRQDA